MNDQPCRRCNGTGYGKAPRPISNPPCAHCNGTGRVPVARSPHSEAIDALLADMPQGRRCPKCDGQMAHSRLNGYQCFRGCQP